MAPPSVIDTNVLVVANGRRADHASAACKLVCVRALREVQTRGHLVLDQGFRILNEYKNQAREGGQPGVGDAFLKWALTNWKNSTRCTLISVAEHAERGFERFPDDRVLVGFDPSDRKFVAVALGHEAADGTMPRILNATDTDWHEHRAALEAHGLVLDFLCPDAMPDDDGGG